MERTNRYALGVILLFVALNAFGGSIYGLSGAKDIPRAWLEGSPFSSYFIPSLVLLLTIAIPFLVSGILVFRRHAWSARAAFFCATMFDRMDRRTVVHDRVRVLAAAGHVGSRGDHFLSRPFIASP